MSFERQKAIKFKEYEVEVRSSYENCIDLPRGLDVEGMTLGIVRETSRSQLKHI